MDSVCAPFLWTRRAPLTEGILCAGSDEIKTPKQTRNQRQSSAHGALQGVAAVASLPGGSKGYALGRGQECMWYARTHAVCSCRHRARPGCRRSRCCVPVRFGASPANNANSLVKTSIQPGAGGTFGPGLRRGGVALYSAGGAAGPRRSSARPTRGDGALRHRQARLRFQGGSRTPALGQGSRGVPQRTRGKVTALSAGPTNWPAIAWDVG